MSVYIFVELQSISSLPDIMNCLLERSIKFTVSKDRSTLCDRCSARDEIVQQSATNYLQSLPHISSPSSASIELIDAYPRSESVDSEPSDNVKVEGSSPLFPDTTPLKDEMEEVDLVACGSELLQQVSANFSSYQEKLKTSFTDSESALIREKGAGSAPKQCQLCGHWITAKNVRAHVATHLTIRRLRCTLCGQGFDRMNRASIHIDKCHSGDPMAKVESAMNAEQRKEIEMLARKCFPRKNRSSTSDEVT